MTPRWSKTVRRRREGRTDDREMNLVQRDTQMTNRNQTACRETRLALQGLRSSTAANLRAFNNAAPYASRLSRSEMKRFTVDLLWSTKRAPQRRWPSLLGKMVNTLSWIRRARAASQLP